MMTIPRQALGRLRPQEGPDPYLGAILYVQDMRLIVCPQEVRGSTYWCLVLGDLAQASRPAVAPSSTHRNVAVDALAVAHPDVDIVSADAYLAVWFARLATRVWPEPEWDHLRRAVQIARVPGSIRVAMYQANTQAVCKAITDAAKTTDDDGQGFGPDQLRRLFEGAVKGGLLRRLTDGVALSFGTFEPIADDLPNWPVSALDQLPGLVANGNGAIVIGGDNFGSVTASGSS